MPALTPPRQYPYPLDGDPINVAGDIQKLAMKIDDDVTAVVASIGTGSTNKYDKTGGPITGNATISGTLGVTGIVTLSSQTKINDRLDVMGDAAEGIYLSNADETPHLTFHHHTSGEGFAAIRIASGDLYVDGDNDVFFRSNNVPAMALVGTVPMFLIGKTVPNPDTTGCEIYTTGNGRGRITTTTGFDESYANLICRHVGEMDGDTELFILFTHGTGSNVSNVGSIAQVGSSGVKYNTTSDYRIKNDLGPIPDAAARVLALAPKHLSSKLDGMEFDGFMAHEVQAIVPDAVTGLKDAVLPDTDEFNPGGLDLQQLDMSRLVPLLTAGLQDALTRIAALEAAP